MKFLPLNCCEDRSRNFWIFAGGGVAVEWLCCRAGVLTCVFWKPEMECTEHAWLFVTIFARSSSLYIITNNNDIGMGNK